MHPQGSQVGASVSATARAASLDDDDNDDDEEEDRRVRCSEDEDGPTLEAIISPLPFHNTK